MPIYEYECADCGVFTASKPMTQYREPHACPNCSQSSARALLTAPAYASMPAVTRTANAINEKARHEPQTSAERAARHGASCGCCSGGLNKGRTVQAKDGSKAFPTARPWMISH
ncbi:MAG TPA: zinc ribbon domain-containing protein [Burkholderiales bacterium]|nr:zinc ribbon domain-containing protein [Burkholderiales bacterium]